MARVLAELLGKNEPAFHLGLRQMERAAGGPAADIKLVLQIEREVRVKMALLGLDPANTTGPELFRALEEKLKSDEMAIRSALKLADDADSSALLQAVQHYLTHETNGNKVFAVKASAMKTLLKKLKPKATMKALGYRSQDSMFKHEGVAQMLVAVDMCESEEWRQARLKAYEKLEAKDFELRDVSFVMPTGKKWPELSAQHTEARRHNQITLVELGSVVMLPIERDLQALAIVSLVLGFQAYDDIRARSAFLKLHQVKPDFSHFVREVSQRDPDTGVSIGGQSLTWKLVHWFYGSGMAPYHPDLFEPHLQEDDFSLHDIHASLESLDEALGFWRGSHVLGMSDSSGPISLNILDVALGVCNDTPFASRFVHNMRESLGREVIARYLHHDNLHNMLEDTLGRELAPEMEFDA